MTNQTEHHDEAILREAVPVAWLYEREGQIFTSHNPGSIMFMESDGWTETPLYPASAILDAVREAMAQEWLPIESAPKDGTWFLAFEPDGQCDAHYACQYYGEGGEGEPLWSSSCGQYVTVPPEPSHWMPLPAPPIALATGDKP